MGINLKIDINKAKELPAEVSSFFVKRSGWILALIGLLFLLYFCYLWYIYISNPSWSDDQKQQYISTKESSIMFDQKKFDAVIKEVERRKNEYTAKIEGNNDIFRLK
jgi:hypothetical protein